MRYAFYRAATKARMIPTQHGIFHCDWCGHDANFIEASIPLGANDQRFAIVILFNGVGTMINEYRINVIAIDRFQFIPFCVFLFDQFGPSLHQHGM